MSHLVGEGVLVGQGKEGRGWGKEGVGGGGGEGRWGRGEGGGVGEWDKEGRG